MTESLRLSDILGRSVTIEWFESVAMVCDVGDRVRESLGGRQVPELHQIELAPDGHVSLSGAMDTDEPVRRLGQLLQATLADADPPVQLRLTASQATAPSPAFGSIRDFTEALAYFERPDRQAVLRGLYERTAVAPAHETQTAPTLDAMAPLEPLQSKTGKKPAPAQAMGRRRAVPAMVAAVVLIVGAATYWQFASAAPSTAQVSAMAVKASDAVGTALVSGLSTVTDSVGLGRLAPADGSGSTPPVKPTETKTLSQAVSPSRKPAKPIAAPAFRIFDLGTQLAPGPLPEEMPPVVSTVVEIPPERPDSPDGNVYSASDPDVVAPIGVRPQLPAVLPGDVNRNQLGQIELLVLPDGTVGSVKLVGRPRSVLEGMLLSAAKAWQFQPAMKDGRPVSYRKLVWLLLD